jgi:hypothetical protein
VPADVDHDRIGLGLPVERFHDGPQQLRIEGRRDAFAPRRRAQPREIDDVGVARELARTPQALAYVGDDLAERDAHGIVHGECPHGNIDRLVVLFHSGPLSRGVLGGSPELYQTVELRRGTATSQDLRDLGQLHELRDEPFELLPLLGIRAEFQRIQEVADDRRGAFRAVAVRLAGECRRRPP